MKNERTKAIQRKRMGEERERLFCRERRDKGECERGKETFQGNYQQESSRGTAADV